MTSICIIGVWFGPFPNWMDLWVKSVEYNPTIHFLVATDQVWDKDTPDNLEFLPTTLSELKRKTEEKIGMRIRMESAYKLCDYKPLYGLIFENEIRDYDYWGECDFDLVFGDIRGFIDRYDILQYDKFLNRGHLTIYRNDRSVIDRYRLKGGAFGTFREIFRSDMVWGLDEMYGINRIYKKHKFPCFNQCVFADIDRKYADMRLCSTYFRPDEKYNHPYQMFCWKEGRVYQEYFDENSVLQTKEFMYIHFAKRRYDRPEKDVIEAKQYCITPYGFIKYPQKMTISFIQDHNDTTIKDVSVRKDQTSTLDKKLKFFWIGRRYLNFKYWLKKK